MKKESETEFDGDAPARAGANEEAGARHAFASVEVSDPMRLKPVESRDTNQRWFDWLYKK